MKHVNIILLILVFVNVAFISFAFNYLSYDCESCVLYNTEVKHGLNGIAVQVGDGYNVTGEYYCVWTQERTYQEINDTEVHEKCHILIWRDYEHFCGDK